MNQMVDVAKLVLTKAGLDPALVSDVQLDAAMRRRTMKVCAFEGADYGAVLSSDLAEQQAFLEELLVRESWFFRDRSPFALVKAQARQRPRPLRILSAPCANGEEHRRGELRAIFAETAPGGGIVARVNKLGLA